MFRPHKPFTPATSLPSSPAPKMASAARRAPAHAAGPSGSAPAHTPVSVWQTLGLPFRKNPPPVSYASNITAAALVDDLSEKTFWEILDWMSQWEVQERVADQLPVLRYKGGALGYLGTNPVSITLRCPANTIPLEG